MPKWLANAVFYEIYPQSFQDTNSDGIGDIQGIINGLDYIKYLGCNAIWLNPCFESPFNDAGYDISDYYKVAPRYGRNADIKRLFEEVHKRDMHILLDLVPGHTSIEHKWFKESMKAENNEYSDRYIWTNSIWESPEGIASIRGVSDRDGSCGVNFFSSQPALNYGYAEQVKIYQKSQNSPAAKATKKAIKDIMRYWLKMGCDGFRVDMAGTLVKNDPHGKENILLWNEFRDFLDDEFPESALVSEWGEPDKAITGGFHMDFLLHFGPKGYNSLFRCEKPFFSKEGKGDSSIFADQYKTYYKLTRGKGFICIPSGNHDMDRLSRGRDIEDLKICFAFLLTMPGVPFIYYGDEIGMRYVEGLKSVEGGYGRTGSRSPMQWNENQVNCGFSECTPEQLYIKMDSNENRPTVEAQLKDKNSLLNEVKKLIEIRNRYTAFQSNGGFSFVQTKKGYPMIYRRTDVSSSQEFIVIINPSDKELVCNFEDKNSELNVIHFVNEASRLNTSNLIVPPCSATIFSVIPKSKYE